MRGYSITLIPMSWALGRQRIRKKTVWAFGPFRFSIHRGLGPWKVVQTPNTNGNGGMPNTI